MKYSTDGCLFSAVRENTLPAKSPRKLHRRVSSITLLFVHRGAHTSRLGGNRYCSPCASILIAQKCLKGRLRYVAKPIGHCCQLGRGCAQNEPVDRSCIRAALRGLPGFGGNILPICVSAFRRFETAAGIVSSTGQIEEGTGFTVRHLATGEYDVRFEGSFFPTGCAVMLVQTWVVLRCYTN